MSKAAKVGKAFAILLLLATGVIGTYNGLMDMADRLNPWQRGVTIGVLIYGIFGLATAYGVIRRRRWAFPTAIVWAVCVTCVPGVAVMAFGGEDAILRSAITASSASLVLAIAVVWIVHANTRAREVPGATAA